MKWPLEIASLYLGEDDRGHFLSFVERKSGIYHSIQLNPYQVILLAELALKETLKIARKEACQEPVPPNDPELHELHDVWKDKRK